MYDKRCLDYRRAIKESEQQLFCLERHQTRALLRALIRFLRVLKSGECSSQAQAGRVIGLGLLASEKLWRMYREHGTARLLHYSFAGRKPKLSEEGKEQFQQELRQHHTQTIEQARAWLEQQIGVHYSRSGMHYVLQDLRTGKKTGRPVHPGKDTHGERHFKKTLPGAITALRFTPLPHNEKKKTIMTENP